MVEFTDFEIELLKLSWVHARLGTIYEKYPMIIKEAETRKQLKEFVYFTSVIRETIIVQLDNFNKIRETMIEKENRIIKIDSMMRDLWKPIKIIENGITDYRNNYIAHIQQPNRFHSFIPFDTLSEEIIIKHKMPITFGHWIFLAGCASNYCVFIKKNFKKELDEVFKKIQEHKKEKLSDKSILKSSIGLNNYEQKLSEIIEKIKSDLKQQNLKF